MTTREPARILLVDDDRAFRLSTAELLREDGYAVVAVAQADEAIRTVRNEPFDLILLDLRMPDTDGMDVLEELRSSGEATPILMITGFGSIDVAVRALHHGADDFLTKPLDPDVLSSRVAELIDRRPSARGVEENALHGIVGRAPAMQAVFEAVRNVSGTDATVLITGETGTGKELVARAIHDLSPRRAGPFVPVNCASVAEGLLESELFGHVRGAFTGAVRDKAGLFDAARGGTLLLDEIGDTSASLQQRLLRVLQEHEVTPVGSVKARQVDVRVIAATNRDLRDAMQEGRFREDLFYRLNVFHIALPPLRERRSDVPLLVEVALQRLRAKHRDFARLSCSPLAMHMLRAHSWPGNVREVFAAVQSAAIHAGGTRIEAQHLPVEIRGADHADEGGTRGERYHMESSDTNERETILAALEEAHGVRARAAEILGMGRTTLWRKMKQNGLASGDDDA
jgi:two-component system response regulator HydG